MPYYNTTGIIKCSGCHNHVEYEYGSRYNKIGCNKCRWKMTLPPSFCCNNCGCFLYSNVPFECDYKHIRYIKKYNKKHQELYGRQ